MCSIYIRLLFAGYFVHILFLTCSRLFFVQFHILKHRQAPQKPYANNQKHLKKTNSIFVEDDGYGKHEYDYHNENNNKKHLPAIVTQHQPQLPSKTNFAQSSVERGSHQASLDIPSRDDEDNKSQHSSRTMSSSRRQSTEDSIDTDDEYFCYELRKLEEMERRSQLESANLSGNTSEDIQQSLLSKIDALNTGTDIWYKHKTFHTVNYLGCAKIGHIDNAMQTLVAHTV